MSSRAPRPKRTATMKLTSEEGKALLADEPEVKASRTRGKRRQSDAVQALSTNDGDLDLASLVLPTGPEIDKERQELMMVFRVFDRRYQGRLDKEDVGEMMRSLGKRAMPKKIDAFFAVADKDNDGFVDAKEFIDYMLRKRYAKLARDGPKKKKPLSPAPKKKAAARGKKGKTEAPASPTPIPAAVAPVVPAAANAAPGPAPAPTPAGPVRSRSIVEFYTSFAGMHEINAATADEHKNPEGREYDLGREGAFTGFTIAIFNGIARDKSKPDQFIDIPIAALKTKGFTVVCSTREGEFASHLATADEAWIVSGSEYTVRDEAGAFVTAVAAFLAAGKGVAIWADNHPYTVHANDTRCNGEFKIVLVKVADCRLQGNDKGGIVLDIGDGNVKSHFARSVLTSGIVRLFEGETISHPISTGDDPKKKVLATGSAGHPCMLYRDRSPSSGRLLVDCGFTKLYQQHWTTAGTSRYVRNAGVWLLDLEHRVSLLPPRAAADTQPAPAAGIKHFPVVALDTKMTEAKDVPGAPKAIEQLASALAARTDVVDESVATTIKECFNILNFKPTAVSQLVEAAAKHNMKLRLLTDAEVTALGDIPRPRGPAEFFLRQGNVGAPLDTVIIADGKPYLSYHTAPQNKAL